MEVHPRAAITAAIAVTTIAATAATAAGCGTSPKASPAATAPASPAASAPVGAPTGPVSHRGPTIAPPPTAAPGSRLGGNGSPGRCHTSMLSAHVVVGQPGAGQHYAELVLTNTSGATCKIYGYPGMQLVSASGGQVPTAVDRQPGAERLVTLGAGQQVSSLLHWTIVPGTGEGSPCQPTASGLIVTPPDETSPLRTSWPGGPVCQHGQVFVTAFQPGANAA